MQETNLHNPITELVCTRISHDIIGNVGAVANAVELLEEGDIDFLDDIKSILKVSSKVLTARLKFFRMAFGLANKNLEDISTIEKTIKDYLQTIGNSNYPIHLDFNLKSTLYAREAMLTSMILADVLIKGGRLQLNEHDEEFIAMVQSESPLATEKINNIKKIIQGITDETQAQFAPVVYLQKILNNHKKINIIEQNSFGFVIR